MLQRHLADVPLSRLTNTQGVLKALNVNKLTKSGVTFKFWYATSKAYSCRPYDSKAHFY